MAFSQLNDDDLEPIIHLSVDILKIEQVIRNLLSNAIKFTSIGRITVTATVVSDIHTHSSEKVRGGSFCFDDCRDAGRNLQVKVPAKINLYESKSKILDVAFLSFVST